MNEINWQFQLQYWAKLFFLPIWCLTAFEKKTTAFLNISLFLSLQGPFSSKILFCNWFFFNISAATQIKVIHVTWFLFQTFNLVVPFTIYEVQLDSSYFSITRRIFSLIGYSSKSHLIVEALHPTFKFHLLNSNGVRNFKYIYIPLIYLL